MSTWRDGAIIFDDLDRIEGRDLDERVAMEVLGHVWMHDEYGSLLTLPYPDDEPLEQDDLKPGRGEPKDGDVHPDHYSTSMDYAWLVVEHLVAQGWTCSLNTALYAASPGSYADCRFQKWLPDAEHRGQVRVMLDGDDHASTMPLAICRAALRAVEAERLDAQSRD